MLKNCTRYKIRSIISIIVWIRNLSVVTVIDKDLVLFEYYPSPFPSGNGKGKVFNST